MSTHLAFDHATKNDNKALCWMALALLSGWWAFSPAATRASEGPVGAGGLRLPTAAQQDPLALLREALVDRMDEIRHGIESLAPPHAGRRLRVSLGPVTAPDYYRTNRVAGIRLLLAQVLQQNQMDVCLSARDPADAMIELRYRFVGRDLWASPEAANGAREVPDRFAEFRMELVVGNSDGEQRKVERAIVKKDTPPQAWDPFENYMLGYDSDLPQVILASQARTPDSPPARPTHPSTSRRGGPAASDRPPDTKPQGEDPTVVPTRVLVPQYQVRILTRQQGRYVVCPSRHPDGRDFAVLGDSEEFAVQLTNNGDRDAAAQLTVDGVNVFCFSQEWGRYWFFVVPKRSSLLVKGWHRDNNTSDAFMIGDYSKSVAARLLRNPSSVGTVTAQFAAVWYKPEDRPADEPKVRGSENKAVVQGPKVESSFEETYVYHGTNWKTVSLGYMVSSGPQADDVKPVAAPQPTKAAGPLASATGRSRGGSGEFAAEGPTDKPLASVATQDPPPSAAVPRLGADITPPEHRWAVLVTASSYTGLVQFPSRHESMVALKECLVKAGFPEDHVLVFSDQAQAARLQPTCANIEKCLQWLRGKWPEPGQPRGRTPRLTKADEVFVAMALYGVRAQNQQVLCPVDSTLRVLPGGGLEGANLVPVEKVEAALAECEASRKLLVLNIYREDPRPRAKGQTQVPPLESFDDARLRPPKGYAELIGYDHRDRQTQSAADFLNTVLLGLQGYADQDDSSRARVVSLFKLAAYVEQHGNVSRLDGPVTTVSGQDYPIAKVPHGATGGTIVVKSPQETMTTVADHLLKHGMLDEAVDAYSRALARVRQEQARTTITAARARAHLARGDISSAQKDWQRIQAAFWARPSMTAKVVLGSTVLATLQAGEAVTVTGFQEDWVGVEVARGDAKQRGWVHKQAFLFRPEAKDRAALQRYQHAYQQAMPAQVDPAMYDNQEWAYDE